MAQLPADRTKLAQAQSNMAPSFTASSQKLKDALTEAYDTVDLLNQKADNHAAAATLPHADKSVTRAKLADKVVGAGQLDDTAVGQTHHQDNGIPGRALPDNVILQRHMSDNSVGSAELQVGAVTSDKLNADVKDSANHTYSGIVPSASTTKSAIESVYNRLLSAVGVSSLSETVDARMDGVNGVSYVNLKERLDPLAVLTPTLEENILQIPTKYLNVPSPLNDALATHPSVIDFSVAWNGYRYWMAYTPYPGTQNENPCIAASNDNVNWVLPASAPNPLVPAPTAPDYYSDTEMVYLPDVNKLRMYYRKALAASSEGAGSGVEFYYIESANGTTWSAPALCLTSTSGMHLSPCIKRISATDWRMWYVESQTKFGYRTSTNGISWSSETLINQPTNITDGLWHIGIFRDSAGTFHMLGSGWSLATREDSNVEYRPMYYAKSVDGLIWTGVKTPQLIPSGWAGGYLYRPCLIVDETKTQSNGLPYVNLWYGASGNSNAPEWHIGYSAGYIQDYKDSNASLTNKMSQRKKRFDAFRMVTSILQASVGYFGSLFAKKITLKDSFNTPIVVLEDARPSKPDGGQFSIDFSNDTDPLNARVRFLAKQQAANPLQAFLQMNPFTRWIGFANGTGFLQNMNKIYAGDTAFDILVRNDVGVDINVMKWNNALKAWDYSNLYTLLNLLDVRSKRLIVYDDGLRVYNIGSTTAFNRIFSDSSGNLNINLLGGGSNFTWLFRGDGIIDASLNGMYGLNGLGMVEQTARPGYLTSARRGAYVADQTTHNPNKFTGGRAYPVFWDGFNHVAMAMDLGVYTTVTRPNATTGNNGVAFSDGMRYSDSTLKMTMTCFGGQWYKPDGTVG